MIPSTRRPSAFNVIAFAAVLLGAFLRWHHLGLENLWLDEAYSIGLGQSPVPRILQERWTDIHPPLYYLSLHFWMIAGGHTEAGARMLSALFDTATILATYAVASRLLDRPAGALAALLVAVSTFHVEFAQEARMYALLALTSTLSMHGFVSLVTTREPDTDTVLSRPAAGRRLRRRWPLYVIATALMMYTHIYSAFILAAQGVTIGLWVMTSRDRRTAWMGARAWASGLGGVLVCYLPWVSVLVNQATRVQGTFWIPRPSWTDGASVLRAYAGSEQLATVLTALVIAGAVCVFLRRRPDDGLPPVAVLVPWLLAPIVLPFLASQLGTPIFLPKYTIAASIPFAILAAYGLTRIPHPALRAPALVLVGILAWHALDTFYGTRRREGWKSAVAAVESRADSGDVLLFYPAFNFYPFSYYLTRTDLQGVAFPLAPLVPIPESPAREQLLHDIVGDKPRVWLIALQGAPERISIGNGLAADRVETAHLLIDWVSVDLFERRK